LHFLKAEKEEIIIFFGSNQNKKFNLFLEVKFHILGFAAKIRLLKSFSRNSRNGENPIKCKKQDSF